MKYKKLKVWFVDTTVIEVEDEVADNAAVELFRYSKEGSPRFIDLGHGRYYAASLVDTFYLTEEGDNNG